MATNIRLAVLAEANATIGLGHYTRCLSLALMVDDLVEVCFYAIDTSHISETLDPKYSYRQISSNEEFIGLLDQNTIALVDGYNYSIDLELKIQERALKLIRIDDEYKRPIVADYLINQAPGVTAYHYGNVKDTTYLLGPSFALLRPDFFNVELPLEKEVKKVLVCFGGADPKNISKSVVKLLLGNTDLKKVHLILGSANQNLGSFNQFKQDDRLEIHHNLSARAMVNVMVECGLAIVPSSGILIECLALKTLCLSGYYTSNQQNLYKGWVDLNGIIGVEDFSKIHLEEGLLKAWKNQNTDINLKLVDRKSKSRYRDIFKAIIAEV